MVQIVCVFVLFLIFVIPMGNYTYHVATNKKTFGDPLFDRVDNLLYKVLRIDKSNMSFKKYVATLLLVNGVMVFVGYFIVRLQSIGLFNPNGVTGMEQTLSYNTIISFMTNTNLQHYAGESQLSYLSQMLVIIFMMFTSAATGYSACMAMIRGLCGKELGNYYVDMTRCITRILLPISFFAGLFLVSQGVPQTLQGNISVETIEGKFQDIAQGPIAALESIKHLGTNGGGFLGANSSTPLENPTILSNIAEMLLMMMIPASCVIVFGRMVHEKVQEKSNHVKQVVFGSQGRTIFIAMSILFLIGLGVCYYAELQGNPILKELGISQSMGSMEGKEMRFGVAQSSLFTTITTSFTTGSVNNMHDTLTPLGGCVPLLLMMLNVVFGGAGVGLMNMLIYAMLAVFICGLMIGRTPEYLGKKIEGKEMKLIALSIIVHPLLILGFSALALVCSGGLDAITNPSFHGLSQVLYEFSSSAANNGSGFEGLLDNNAFWNITCGLVMFFGRYIAIVIQLAVAHSLLKKHYVNETIGTLKTDTMTFSLTLVMVVIIIAALTFLPALALGPIAEHLTLWT
ncbi:MAG: potassium-transporting ATPase subunit KdpA [Longicatena sp.]